MIGRDLIMATLFGSGGSSGSGGGGAAGVSPKEVNFYDYDGTCVHAYTVAEAQALSELPAGPEHPGLVFQGWNWSLEGVKGLTRAMNIGAMYTTDDGTTRLYITLQEGRTSPMLGVGVNGTVTVDWGDGTEPDVLTGTSVDTAQWTPNHAYAVPGDYVIRLTVDGEMAFVGNSSTNQYSCVLRHVSGTDTRNSVYQKALERLEIGDNVKVNNYGFNMCARLSVVTLPPNMQDAFNASAFGGCGFHYFAIPLGATALGGAFKDCRNLIYVSIPEGTTNTGYASFTGCSSLENVTIPDSVVELNDVFNGCANLREIVIPKRATKLSYGNTFYGCAGLSHMIIPGTIAYIAATTFSNCYGMAYYDFTACTAVPTLAATSAFNKISDDCEIRVPAVLYDEWIAATNWVTYASQIKAY